MLLAIDIGNSNISVGLFDEKRDLKFLSSIDTDSRKTADQISIDLMNIFSLYRYDLRDVSGAIFSSVVPPINFMMAKALTRLLGKPPMIVGPGVKTGLNIRMEIHNQLGADLVAGAVAALDKYPTPIIMIDMGTATTISYISSKRSYEGGLMFPGVRLSLDALSDHTAQLPDISLQHPKSLIGKNTEDCMRSGIVYGTAGMLDGVIDRIRELLPQGETPTIVATGSNAPVIVRYCRNKVLYDKYLLMEGLWDIYQKIIKTPEAVLFPTASGVFYLLRFIFTGKRRVRTAQNLSGHFSGACCIRRIAFLKALHVYGHLFRIPHRRIQNSGRCICPRLQGVPLCLFPGGLRSRILVEHGKAGGQIGVRGTEHALIPILIRHLQQAIHGSLIIPLRLFESGGRMCGFCQLQIRQIKPVANFSGSLVPLQHLLPCTGHFKAKPCKKCPGRSVLVIGAERSQLFQKLHPPLHFPPADVIQCVN